MRQVKKPLSIRQRVTASHQRGVKFHRMCLDDESARQILRDRHWRVERTYNGIGWVVLDAAGKYLARGRSPRAAIEHALVPRTHP